MKPENGARTLAKDLAKTVLVTGGAGFLGQRLVHKLLDEDFSTCVVVLDSGITGNFKGLIDGLDARLNLADPRGERAQRTVIIQGDIRDASMYQGIAQAMSQLKAPPLREVYNLACPASPAAYAKHPVETLLTATLGLAQVLSFCDKIAPAVWQGFPPPRVVHASTSEVYGDYLDVSDTTGQMVDAGPIPESYVGSVAFRGPRACYDEGKRAGEALIFDMMRVSQRGLDVRTARLFNAYGPGMLRDDGRVMSAFITAALRNEPLTICGDGQQTRSFTYVDDTIKGLMDLMALPLANDHDMVFNLGDPSGEITMNDLAFMVLEAVEAKDPPPVHHVAARPDEPRFRVPDVTLAREKLGWNPQVSLKEGIARTVQYLRDDLAKEELAKAQPKMEKGRILLDS